MALKTFDLTLNGETRRLSDAVLPYADLVRRDGASAYWRLGETSGLTAFDSIGTAHGTISGGVMLNQAGPLGDGNRAMAFDGASGRIAVPVGAYSAFGTQPFSLEAWVNPTTAHNGILIDTMNQTTNGPGAALFITLAREVFLKIGNGVGNVGTITTGGPMQPGWHHLVGTVVQGANYVLSLYVDGILLKTQSFGALGWNLTTPLATALASAAGTPAIYLNGALDDVAIYPTALTPSQIAAHYAASSRSASPAANNIPYRSLQLRPDPANVSPIVIAGGNAMVYRNQVIADGATAYWRLDEASGTVAKDSIGSAHGTISGGVTLNQAGALGDGTKAMAFNGTTGQIVAGPLTLAASCTIEAWIKTSVGGVQQPFFSNGQGNGTVYVGTSSPPVGVMFVYVPGATPVGVTSLSGGLADNQWRHLVAVLTPTQTLLYRDGVLTDTLAHIKPTATAAVAQIGSDINLTGTNRWNGLIDDVAYYPTALTPAQIANHYALSTYAGGPGLAIPLTLGPFSRSGPLTLADLYASGTGRLLVTGVPF
jgi:hypothetical protein